MRFGREVEHGPRAMLVQQTFNQRRVEDAAADEGVLAIRCDRGEVLQVARVGQGVEVDDGFIAGGEPVEDEVAADEAGARQ